MRNGHTPTDTAVDETHREAEDRARRFRVAHMRPLKGYRYMGRRRKRDLRDLRIVLEPDLRVEREKEQARRRKIRADRKANPPVKVDIHFDPDIPKGWARDLPGIPPGLLEANEPKRMRR